MIQAASVSIWLVIQSSFAVKHGADVRESTNASWSITPSTTLRATDLRRRECGIEWWVGTDLEESLLDLSPLAEPVEQISRNGLPRLHSRESI